MDWRMADRDTIHVHILTLSHNLASSSFVRQPEWYLHEWVIKEHHPLNLALGCSVPLLHVTVDTHPLPFGFQEDLYARSLSDTLDSILQDHKRYNQKWSNQKVNWFAISHSVWCSTSVPHPWHNCHEWESCEGRTFVCSPILYMFSASKVLLQPCHPPQRWQWCHNHNPHPKGSSASRRTRKVCQVPFPNQMAQSRSLCYGPTKEVDPYHQKGWWWMRIHEIENDGGQRHRIITGHKCCRKISSTWHDFPGHCPLHLSLPRS